MNERRERLTADEGRVSGLRVYMFALARAGLCGV